jgi:hypothetical protein
MEARPAPNGGYAPPARRPGPGPGPVPGAGAPRPRAGAPQAATARGAAPGSRPGSPPGRPLSTPGPGRPGQPRSASPDWTRGPVAGPPGPHTRQPVPTLSDFPEGERSHTAAVVVVATIALIVVIAVLAFAFGMFS